MQPNGYTLDFTGFLNYKDAFLKDPEFRQILVETVGNMFLQTPVIIIFSFFSALLLNQKFHGRAIARAFFFLPVILSADAVVSLVSADAVLGAVAEKSNETFELLGYDGIKEFFYQVNINPKFLDYITGTIEQIYTIIMASGVQILIFLAALQTVSPSLYEASDIEGATKWESFWKITFPMVSSMILVNVVYTIIDSFVNSRVVKYMQDLAFDKLRFGYSSALAWIYFVVVAVIIGVVSFLISRKVFYYD